MRNGLQDRRIDLSIQSPLVIGGERVVFQDPRSEKSLIKVARSPHAAPQTLFRRYGRWRFGRLYSWSKEQEEYLALLARGDSAPDFVAGFLGYCNTTFGIGMIVEKITDDKGSLAPTFWKVAQFATPEQRVRLTAMVDAFFDELIMFKCVASDLRPKNVVVRGDFERLVLVDGLGDAVIFKTKQFFPYLHRRDMDKKRLKFHSLLQRPSIEL